MISLATTMTAEEVAAWEDLARTGQLGRYLDTVWPRDDYQRALKAQIKRRRAAQAPP